MPTSTCPDPDDLENLAEGTLDPERDRALLAHLADCPECRQRLDQPVWAVDVERWRAFWNQRGGASTIGDRDRSPTALARSLPDPFDGYEILGFLGRGGMSVVYRARQTKLNRPVALKMLLAGAHASAGAIARLRSESETIASLRHPNIVTIHDIGEHQGVPYLCLELIEGGSLADRLGGRPIPPEQARRLVALLARTVQDAHDHGVIHRDLKPANVLLDHPAGTPPEAWERLRLTDFGLAKRLDSQGGGPATRTGDVVGTPAYMAPEQVVPNRSAVGPAVDVYGLGAILYELLTGRPPFQADSPFETAMMVISRRPAAPSASSRDVPPELDALCLQCLEKDPRRRPGSAGELAEMLQTGDSRILPRSRNRRRRAAIGVAAFIACVGVIPLLNHREPREPDSTEADPPVPSFNGPVERKTAYFGARFIDDGRLHVPGVTDDDRPKEARYAFDLCDRHKPPPGVQLVEKLTRNARIRDEREGDDRGERHDIRYWQPEDERLQAEVVYRIDVGFPVASALLHATLDLQAPDSEGELLVSTDPSRGWTPVSHRAELLTLDRYFRITDWVRGSRTIYVKARLKGRDDGEGSSLAQFLRSSTRDGDLQLHHDKVFDLRVSDREIPVVTLAVRYGEDRPWEALAFDDEGRFRLEYLFPRMGHHRLELKASVDGRTPVTRAVHVYVVMPDGHAVFQPGQPTGREGQTCSATIRVVEPPGQSWHAVVDYGDGSGAEVLPPQPGDSIAIRHVYRRAGKYAVFVALTDAQGRMLTAYATCFVTE